MMARTPNPAGQALRDALLAVLRDAEFPLQTMEIVKRVYPAGNASHYGRVYSQLRAMDKLGLVRWLPWGTDGVECTRWEPAEQAETAELELLERLWQQEST